jgi:hypothetical protein
LNSDSAAREALLKASSVFAWHAAATDTRRSSVATGSKKEAKFDSADRYQVRGCVSTELGAHALVKVTTRTGTELGSSVVCVTHLLHRDPTLIRSSVMKEVSASAACAGR